VPFFSRSELAIDEELSLFDVAIDPPRRIQRDRIAIEGHD